MRTLLVVVLFALAGSPAQADTSDTDETKDVKTYGNCHTLTMVDLFTDEERYAIRCGESTLFDETAISIMSQRGRLYVLLSKGVQFHFDDQVSVMIRVDKGELIRRPAQWDSKTATRDYIQDNHLARRLLHDLARGQKVIIQVGDEGGNIRLSGSRRAIDDFRQRAGLQPQQTLEIPVQKKALPAVQKKIGVQKKALPDTRDPPARVKAWIAQRKKSCWEPRQTWWNTKVSKTYPSTYESYLSCLKSAEQETIKGWEMCRSNPSCRRRAGL